MLGTPGNDQVALVSRLRWLRHASFVYEGSLRIALDPWKVAVSPPVDLILVTHDHYDHCDAEAIRQIRLPGTVIVAPRRAAELLPGMECLVIRPEEEIRLGDVTVTATWAYNLEAPFHPRGQGVGYCVRVDGGTIFHAGDTDDIPETHGLKPDLALLPVGGTYTMDVPEAAQAAAAIGASLTVPMHYGFIVGSKEDGDRLAKSARVPVRVLTPKEAFSR